MAIPLSPKLSWDLANPLWASTLNPIILNPLNGVQILQNVPINTGLNYIPHGLGRLQQGWFIVDLQGAISFYRSSPFNSNMLVLTATGTFPTSGIVLCSLGVF